MKGVTGCGLVDDCTSFRQTNYSHGGVDWAFTLFSVSSVADCVVAADFLSES